MRILHIHPSLNTGGIEAMISNLAGAMSELHDISVCSIFKPEKDTYLWNKLPERIYKFSLGKITKGFSLKEIWKIYKAIYSGKYDVVQLHGFFMYYILAVILLHNKSKFFYTVHSDAQMENSHWDRRFFYLKKLAFKLGWVHPITISKESQLSFQKLYETPSILIPNGIATNTLKHSMEKKMQAFRLTPKTKLFIHIGRIDTPKNQVVMCRCVERLIKEGNDIVLLIAGPIANQQIFMEIQPFLSQRIVYLGEITDAREYLACADAMLLPSIWEGLPVTLLEAISVGCIPICSPVGGIVNVIENEKTGILSKSSSELDYFKALQSYLNFNQAELEKMKIEMGQEFYRKYHISIAAKKYLAAYDAIKK